MPPTSTAIPAGTSSGAILRGVLDRHPNRCCDHCKNPRIGVLHPVRVWALASFARKQGPEPMMPRMTSDQSVAQRALRDLIATLQEVDERYLGDEWNAPAFGDLADGFRSVANVLERRTVPHELDAYISGFHWSTPAFVDTRIMLFRLSCCQLFRANCARIHTVSHIRYFRAGAYDCSRFRCTQTPRFSPRAEWARCANGSVPS